MLPRLATFALTVVHWDCLRGKGKVIGSLRFQAMSSLAGAVIGVIAFSHPLQAQVPQETQGLSSESSVAISDDIELRRLIDLAAVRLGLTIEYDAPAVAGTVTVRGAGNLQNGELWDLLNRLLTTNGQTTIRISSGLAMSVVPLAQAADLARLEGVFEIGDDWRGDDILRSGFETVAVRPRFKSADSLVAEVTQLLGSQGGKASHAMGSDLILVSGLSVRVDAILDLLARLDVPGEPVVVELIEPQHVSAAFLQTSATQLSEKLSFVSGQRYAGELLAPDGEIGLFLIAPESEREHWLGLIERLDKREGVESRTYTPRYFGVQDVATLIEQSIGVADIGGQGGVAGDGHFRVIVNDLIGTLIVAATADQHDEIGALLADLDDVPAEARRVVRTIEVRNRGVQELLGVVSGLIQSDILGLGSEEGQSNRKSTEADTLNPVDRAQSISGTAPDRMLNSNGGGETESSRTGESAGQSYGLFAGESVSLTVDEATNSLIAIGEPRALDQLEALIRSLDVRQPQVRIEVVMVSLSEGDSLDLAVQLEKLFDLEEDTTLRLMSLFGLGLPAGAIGAADGGNGLTGTILNPGEFSAVVRALETVNEGRALSRPYLLVGNNQAATFDSVVEEPFVSTNASSTVATTSFGGSKAAGTQISVTPTIAAGDHLEIEYSVSLSTFVGESSDPSVPPPSQESSMSSVSTIPDGYTVVVGGIETTKEGEAITKVPLLGDIPFLGELFKSRGKSRSRSRFFVFIRADVMRGNGFESLKYMSDLAMEEAEVDDGWPEVLPRVIH